MQELPGRSRAEVKCSPHTAVMTGTPVKNNFEMPAHCRGVSVGHTIAKRARQLTELRAVKPGTQIQEDERWDPTTAAVKNLDSAAIEEMLIDIEEPEVAKLDCRHLPEEGDSVALDVFIEELLHELEADEGFEFPVKELEFGVDEAPADITSLLGERPSELVSNSTTPANLLPGDENNKEHTKTLLDARVKPKRISQEGKCVTSEVDAMWATKQKVPKGGDFTDYDVDWWTCELQFHSKL